MFKRPFTLLYALFFLSINLNAQVLEDRGTKDEEFRQILEKQFSAFTLFEFDTDEILNQRSDSTAGFYTNFKIGEKYDWTLALLPNEIKAPNYKLTVAQEMGRYSKRSDRSINTFHGFVEGTGEEARLSIDDNFIYGYIEYGKEILYIEPLRYFVDGAKEDLFVAYLAKDVLETAPKTCAVDEVKKRKKVVKRKGLDFNQSHKHGANDRAAMPGNCYEVELAYANDFSMFTKYGSVAGVENHNNAVLNNVQGNYDDEFGDEIQFLVVEIFVPTSSATDPFTSSTDSGILLDDFTNWGPSGFSNTHDVGALWSDRNFDGSTIGLAWVGAICSSFRYHILEDFTNNAAFLRVLHAHEMGHNFNLVHDGSGTPFIMAPAVSAATNWSTLSVNTFDSYILTIDPPNGCLSFCPPPVPPVAIFSPDNNVICQGSYVTFYDQSINSPNSWSWSFPGGTPNSSTERSPTVQYSNLGSYNVTLTVSNNNGSNTQTLNGIVNVVPAGGTDVFFFEGFESGPGQFTIDNPDGSDTWEQTSVQGTRQGNQAMFVNNFDYNAQGQEDALISPVLDFSGRTNTTLDLEYAYGRYNNQFKDSLKVYVSTNGGSTYTTVFANTDNGAGNFGTVPSTTSEFFPGVDTDWCFATTYGPGCLSLDLSAYDGQNNIVVKIANKNGYGNNMFVDNVRLSSSCVVLNPPQAAFAASQTTGCQPLVVTFTDQTVNNPTSWVWNFPGGSPAVSTQQNPTVVYNTPGVYSVTLTATNGAGADVETINNMINIEGIPIPGFTFVNNNGTVNFTNTSSGTNLSYFWNFGDGNTSTLENPSHTYADDGTYTVELTVSNLCGSFDFEQTLFVESLPVAAFSADPTDVCVGEAVQYTDESSSNAIAWSWTFPGGTPSTSTEQNPLVVYNTSGVYSATLTVSSTLGDDVISQTNIITVNDLPSAGFSESVNGNTVDFTNQSTNATSYLWDFGDGTTSTETDPSYTYATDGQYTVVLTASNDCGDEVFTLDISLSTLPQAGINASVNEGCVPFSVQFFDVSSSNTTGWNWSFEGGNPATSTEQNPTILYETAGVYDVTLIATNPNGADTLTLSDFVRANPQPEADFSFVLNGQEVSLTDLSIDTDSVSWNFGDGNLSTAQNPVYNYGQDGTFVITQYAYNDCGVDSTSQQLVIATPPSADFEADITSGCEPMTVQFSDLSSANTTSWSWTFEGGTPANSTEQNPTVLFETAGVFDVTLIATNSSGSDTLALEDLLTVNPLPEANFSFVINGQSVSFTDLSVGADTMYWDFGDGTQSSEQNPIYNFGMDGVFNVAQIVANGCGADTLIAELVIATVPEANFTADTTEGCMPLSVQFTDLSSSNSSSWAWTFEGGTPATSTEQNPSVVFEQGGVYDVELIVSNAQGQDTFLLVDYIEVFPLPEPGFTVSMSGLDVDFTNTSQFADTYYWTFGDGTDSDQSDPSHTYATEGSFEVVLYAINACDTVSISQQLEISNGPQAGIDSDVQSGCPPLEVQFFNASTADADNWSWTFEGGVPASSTEENPLVTYNEEGLYDVQLIVSNVDGADTLLLEDYIEVLGDAIANFSFTNTGLDLTLQNLSSNATSYSWDFGDGNSSTDTNPVHTYAEDGIYDISLIAESPCGNDTLSQLVEIITPPVADFEFFADTICEGDGVTFTSLASANTTAWAWSFEGANPAFSDEESPTVSYSESGLYNVELIVSNAAGSDTISSDIDITVIPLVEASFNSAVNAGTAVFTNTSQNATSYTWDFGDGNSSTLENPVNEYLEDGTYIVSLIAENSCGADTVTEEVVILLPPAADFDISLVEACTPYEHTFESLATGTVEEYLWLFEGGIPVSSTEMNPTVLYETAGQFDVTLIVSNATGSDTLVAADMMSIALGTVPGFTYVINGQEVSFTNASTNANSYTWDFGDGNGSVDDNPVHTFAADGIYTVTLSATNDCGTNSISEDIIISVGAPIALFEVDAQSDCAPTEVTYLNLSSANADSYLWSFPGGVPSSSTEENPVVTYSNAGTYFASLTVTNANGSDTYELDEAITIYAEPTADFDVSVSGYTASFANNSLNGTSYLWDFGDGSDNSSVPDPIHTYSGPGEYLVTITVENPCGLATLEQLVIITATFPEAFMTADPTSGCVPMEVAFTDQSTGDVTAWLWEFEGGTPSSSTEQNPVVVYQNTGTFDVVLTVFNDLGSNSIVFGDYIEVGKGPEAQFTYGLSGLGGIQFQNGSLNATNYSWDFGDGNSSNAISPLHIYEESGVYEVVLIAFNECGSDTTQQLVDFMATASEDIWDEAYFNVFPNPMEDLLTIQLSLENSTNESFDITIYDILGKEVVCLPARFVNGEYEGQIDLGQRASGVYLLSIESGGVIFTKRIIKN